MHRPLITVTLIFTLVFALSQPIYSSSSATTFRFLSTSSISGQVDLFIDGKKILSDVSNRKGNHYIKLTSGYHLIEVKRTTRGRGTILVSKSMEFNKFPTTLVLFGNNLRLLDILQLDDQVNIEKGKTQLRLLHLLPRGSKLHLYFKGGEKIIQAGSYKTPTEYASIEPGKYPLEVRTGNHQLVVSLPQVQLQPNSAYTLLFYDAKGKVRATLLQDVGFIHAEHLLLKNPSEEGR